MFTFLLVLQAVIAAVLVTLILMQRSEGGGLGVGGSSSGLMTARGQADFLTRATAFTAVAFVGLSILLAGLATTQRTGAAIDTSLSRSAAPAEQAPLPTAPPAADGGQAQPDSIDSDILATIAGQAESDGEESGAEGGE